jgi:hypothetical protein
MTNVIARKGDTATEDLRQAIINIRSLFAELIEADPMAMADAPNASAPAIEGRIVGPRRILSVQK